MVELHVNSYVTSKNAIIRTVERGVGHFAGVLKLKENFSYLGHLRKLGHNCCPAPLSIEHNYVKVLYVNVNTF